MFLHKLTNEKKTKPFSVEIIVFFFFIKTSKAHTRFVRDSCVASGIIKLILYLNTYSIHSSDCSEFIKQNTFVLSSLEQFYIENQFKN